MTKKIYLACPYTDPLPEVRQSRVTIASRIAANLMAKGFVVFSPITHGHAIADNLPLEKRHSHGFWMGQCLPMVKVCDMLLILPLHGWRDSRGVGEEIDFAQANGIPVCIWQGPPEVFDTIGFDILIDEGFTALWFDRADRMPETFTPQVKKESRND